MEGSLQSQRENTAPLGYLPDGNPGPYGGGTYNGTPDFDSMRQEYENIFGPAARDIKFDQQRQKRHQRWHLPDVLKGPNNFLTDRVDGLITDTTNSPFTSIILPYVYLEHPDAKIKWNVWSFDEGLASRAPYESGARVLTQTKRSYAGYTVRQALGIRMEHNFMRSPEGVVNFQRQLKQLVGSIQYGNDLDVHMALISAPSHAQVFAEKYYSAKHTPIQLVRKYVDLFGIMQKTPNALDILIEEAKQELSNWGAQDPSFLLINSKLTMQLQMSPERTSYVTQGIDGVKRLRQGPNIDSYRGLNIIKSRAFSMETGALPRDVLRRRVRVAEYYYIPAGSCPKNNPDTMFEFYDQSKDSWFRMKWSQLYDKATIFTPDQVGFSGDSETDSVPGGTLVKQMSRFGAKTSMKSMRNNGNTHFDMHAASRGKSVRLNTGFERSETEPANSFRVEFNSWSQKGYTMKANLLPVLNNVTIHGPDGEGLHLPTNFYDGEERFAQTIAQTANIASTSITDVRACRDSSAWYGGGIFCDTGYHFIEGHRSQYMMCNWASLDVERMLPDSVNLENQPDEWIYAVQTIDSNGTKSIAQHIYDSISDKYKKFKLFAAYRPNATCFTWAHAHDSQKNIPPSLDRDIASCFARIHVSNNLLDYLWQTPANGQITQDDMIEMYKMIVPSIHASDSDMRHVRSKLGNLRNEVNPWNTTLLIGFNAFFHPCSSFRRKMRNLLDEQIFNYTDSVIDFFKHHSDASMRDTESINFDLQLTGTRKRANHIDIETHAPGYNDKIPTQYRYLNNTHDKERNTALFFLIMMKRIFCGAERFHDGGYGTAENPCGLLGQSMLSRKFAFPVFSTGETKKDDKSMTIAPMSVHEDGSNGSQCANMHLVLIRPNIEHNMLGVVMGRGGVDELGATFWGQTEMNCFDDAEHGLWGMNYKYHERAQVLNEKNMIRLWDIAFDGYNGGMDDTFVDFKNSASVDKFKNDTNNISDPYNGDSFYVMSIPADSLDATNWPNPIVFDDDVTQETILPISADPELIHAVVDEKMRVFKHLKNDLAHKRYMKYKEMLPSFSDNRRLNKPAGIASSVDESAHVSGLAFQGHMRKYDPESKLLIEETQGAGHLGPAYVGVASVREGKGYRSTGAASLHRLI